MARPSLIEDSSDDDEQVNDSSDEEEQDNNKNVENNAQFDCQLITDLENRDPGVKERMQDYIRATKDGGVRGLARLIVNTPSIRDLYNSDRETFRSAIMAPAYFDGEITLIQPDGTIIIYSEFLICYSSKEDYNRVFPLILYDMYYIFIYLY